MPSVLASSKAGWLWLWSGNNSRQMWGDDGLQSIAFPSELSSEMDLSSRLGLDSDPEASGERSRSLPSKWKSQSKHPMQHIGVKQAPSIIPKLTHLILLCSITNFVHLSSSAAQTQDTRSQAQDPNSQSSVQAPSQLFLSSTDHLNRPILLVNGFSRKKSDEEEDGFMMQAAANQATTLDPSSHSQGLDLTTTTQMQPDETTTQSSNQTSELEMRIPIDAYRQHFLTHDQLSVLHKNSADESGIEQKVPTSRSGMSKVSHVSSFLSGEFKFLSFRYANSSCNRLEDLVKTR